MKKQVRTITKSGGQLVIFLEEKQVEELKKDIENPVKTETFLLLPPSGKGEEIFIKFGVIDTMVISPISNIKVPPGGIA